MTIDPPKWAESFHSDDLDEIRERLGRFGSHRRERRGRGPLGFRMASVRVGRSALGWGGSALGQIIHAETSQTVLHLPVSGRVTYRAGRRLAESSPDKAVLISPGTKYTAVSQGGGWLAAQVDDGTLVDELARRETAGVSHSGGVAEIPLDARRAEGLLGLFLEAASSEPLREEAGADIESRLVSWVVDWLSPDDCEGSIEGPLARQRSLEEWIEGHLAETITLGRLCSIAGVGARALQKSFMRQRGQTPMEWVASRRLAAARMRLFEAGDSDSVTEIALRCGISHLGRFAVAYRRTYGESPSASLSRRRP